MSELLEYNKFWEIAYKNIKAIRDPHAERPDKKDFQWSKVEENRVFYFDEKSIYDDYFILKTAKEISIECLKLIIFELSKKYNRKFQYIDKIEYYKISDVKFSLNMLFTLKDLETDILYIFLPSNSQPMWKLKNKEPKDIEEFLKSNNAKECKYIYMLYDYAYLQIVGHEANSCDEGKGYNFYSLLWFFEKFFNIEEKNEFERTSKEFTNKINEYLGFFTMKTLTPNARISFGRIVEHYIKNDFDYSTIVNKKYKDDKNNPIFLAKDDFNKLYFQFFDEKYYLLLLGDNDYSESIITAEWLYDSMKKARAIDLTIIGMGYLKAVEQILYNFICLHKNEQKLIKKDYSKKDLPIEIELNDNNINNENIDTTIGSIAIFYKHNYRKIPNILRNDIHSQRYIIEAIFKFKDIRNGYFHKHNIHDWQIIEEIRKETYYILFLLIGSHVFKTTDLKQLGYPKQEYFNDYYRLCEYVNYHSNEIYFIYLSDERKVMMGGLADPETYLIDKKYVKYSGIYFKEPFPQGTKFKFTQERLPKKIVLGKIEFANTEMCQPTYVEVKTIYENGKFVASLIDEENLAY